MGVFSCKLRKKGAFQSWIKELFISLIYLWQRSKVQCIYVSENKFVAPEGG